MICRECKKRFEPGRRANQFKHAGGRPHKRARFCSDRCRKASARHRERATRTQSAPISEKGTCLHATRTPQEIHKQKQGATKAIYGPSTTSKRLFRNANGEVVRDAKYPNMYRIQWAHGGLSDMVNLSRANDALMNYGGHP